MGRRIEYFCDECRKDFGKNKHLNLKQGDLRISIPATISGWTQRKINMPCQEYHFCNEECLCQWLRTYIKETMDAQPKIQEP